MENPKAQAGEPGLNWVYKPDPKTCQELLEQRRVTNLEQLKGLEPNIGVLKNSEQRLNEREMCFLRMQQKDEKTRTFTEISQKRRKEMVEENT